MVTEISKCRVIIEDWTLAHRVLDARALLDVWVESFKGDNNYVTVILGESLTHTIKRYGIDQINI